MKSVRVCVCVGRSIVGASMKDMCCVCVAESCSQQAIAQRAFQKGSTLNACTCI